MVFHPKLQPQMLDDLVKNSYPQWSACHEILTMIGANSPDNDNAMKQFLEKLYLHEWVDGPIFTRHPMLYNLRTM